MASLILQCGGVVALRWMIVDRIQDEFFDDKVAAINNIVAYILKLVLLLLFFAKSPKFDLMIVNTVHRQEIELLRTDSSPWRKQARLNLQADRPVRTRENNFAPSNQITCFLMKHSLSYDCVIRLCHKIISNPAVARMGASLGASRN